MGFGTPLETTFSLLSFGISSAVPENGYLMFMHCRCVGRKKTCFQSYRSSAFMGRSSQNFAHLQSTMGTIYRKSLTGGYRRKFWENRQKTGIFALVHAKARTVFTSGSKVERTPCRPLSYGSTAVLSVQKFVSVPEL